MNENRVLEQKRKIFSLLESMGFAKNHSFIPNQPQNDWYIVYSKDKLHFVFVYDRGSRWVFVYAQLHSGKLAKMFVRDVLVLIGKEVEIENLREKFEYYELIFDCIPLIVDFFDTNDEDEVFEAVQKIFELRVKK